jgi:8-oxo-dGTP pyrophosphatase MutT (NUDIX family)
MYVLSSIQLSLKNYRARKIPGRRFLKRSSVVLILRDDALLGVCVLMIQRARKRGDPWSGHMAFPGGIMERVDKNINATALRELQEELAVQENQLTACYGRLSDLLTRSHLASKPMVITPFVYSTDGLGGVQPNHEVADTVWVPLRFIADVGNRKTMKWQYAGVGIRLPCYFYQGKRIWGLSLSMLDELIRIIDKAVDLPQYDAPYSQN